MPQRVQGCYPLGAVAWPQEGWWLTCRRVNLSFVKPSPFPPQEIEMFEYGGLYFQTYAGGPGQDYWNGAIYNAWGARVGDFDCSRAVGCTATYY